MAAIHLQVLNVEDPHNFSAKESQGPGMSLEAEAFWNLHLEMQKYFNANSDLCKFRIACPDPGTICAGQRRKDKQWYRVRLKEHHPMIRGHEVSCDLLDFGITERLTVISLRSLNERFLRVPYQAKTYCLHGIQPITMVTNIEEGMTSYEPCTEWEVHAQKYMTDTLREASDIRALHMGMDADNRHLVKIYINHKDGDCLNEILVQKKYAQFKSKEDGADSGLDMTMHNIEAGYASDSLLQRREKTKGFVSSRATHHRRPAERMYDSDTEGRSRGMHKNTTGPTTVLDKMMAQHRGGLMSQTLDSHNGVAGNDMSMESSVYHLPPDALENSGSRSVAETEASTVVTPSFNRAAAVTTEPSTVTLLARPGALNGKPSPPGAAVSTETGFRVAQVPASCSGRGGNLGRGMVAMAQDPPWTGMRGVSPVVDPVLRPMPTGRGLLAGGRGAGILQPSTMQPPARTVSPGGRAGQTGTSVVGRGVAPFLRPTSDGSSSASSSTDSSLAAASCSTPVLPDRPPLAGRGIALTSRSSLSPGRGTALASRSSLSPGRGFTTTSLGGTLPSCLPAAVAAQGGGDPSSHLQASHSMVSPMKNGSNVDQQSKSMGELRSPPSPTRVGQPVQTSVKGQIPSSTENTPEKIPDVVVRGAGVWGRPSADGVPELEDIDTEEEDALLHHMVAVNEVRKVTAGKQAASLREVQSKAVDTDFSESQIRCFPKVQTPESPPTVAPPDIKELRNGRSTAAAEIGARAAVSAKPSVPDDSPEVTSLHLQIAKLQQQLQALKAKESAKSAEVSCSPSQSCRGSSAIKATVSKPANCTSRANMPNEKHTDIPRAVGGIASANNPNSLGFSDNDIPKDFISLKSVKSKVSPIKHVPAPSDEDFPADFISVKSIKTKPRSKPGGLFSKLNAVGLNKNPQSQRIVTSVESTHAVTKPVQLSESTDAMLRNTDDAVAASLSGATSDPSEMPATSDSMDITATSDPSEMPATSDSTDITATSDPSEMPATLDPTDMPATSDPTDMPATSDPTDMPALEEVDVTLNSYEGPSPREDDVGVSRVLNARPVSDPVRNSLMVTAGESDPQLGAGALLNTVPFSYPSEACGVGTSPSAAREAKSRVTFSDIDEYLGPQTQTGSSASKPILKQTASTSSNELEREDSPLLRSTTKQPTSGEPTRMSGSDSESPAAYFMSDSEEEDDMIPGLRGFVQESRLHKLMMCRDQTERTGLGSAGMSQEEILPSSSDVGLLVDGSKPPKPATSVDNFNFHQPVVQGLLDNHLTEPSGLQSYVWPALMRNRNMVCVAPEKSSVSEGLTCDRCLTYMMPFASQILLAGSYEDLPVGSGPLAIVLCSSWRRAQQVYNESDSYLKSIGSLRRLVLFGGGDEEAMDVTLINGCEVLISTIHSALRSLERDIIQLNRMCHLVLDDGDELVEHYTDQVRSFMSAYAHELQERGDKVLPRQLMLLGSLWTVGMGEFMQYMNDPLVIIDSKLESAAYGQVRWRVHICMESCRLSKLLELVDFSDRKTVIWTSRFEEAATITKVLASGSHPCLLADEVLTADELEQVNKEWNVPHQQGHHPILVATDSILLRMNIDNAEQVIHYDLPEKRLFAERLWIMRKNYTLRMTVEKAQQSQSCLSVVLVTETCFRQAPALVCILEQNQEHVPQQLRDLAQGRLEGQEEVKKDDLCHQFKALGHCRNQQRCPARHLINPELDKPGSDPQRVQMPTHGKVQLLVTHMVDGSCYWGRLLRHQVGEGPLVSLSQGFVEMHLQLNVHMANLANRLDLNVPMVGDLYCFEDVQHSWHRVLVRKLGPRNHFGEVTEVEVEFVDRGGVEKVKRDQLRHIPPQFVNIPYQVVEIFSCQLNPVDGNVEWSDRSLYKAAELVFQQEVVGNIVLSLGHTLWLSPLRPVYKSAQGTFYGCTIEHHMVRHNQAVKNADHMKRLYAACRGRIELPEILDAADIPGIGYNPSGLPVDYKTMTLPTKGLAEGHVYVSTVDSPGLFFMQKQDEDEDILATVLDAIRQHLVIHSSNESLENLKVGSLVISSMPSEEDDYMWYRGKILAQQDDEYDVFYVDYGDREWVKKQHLRAFPSRLLKIPFQAMECSMYGLVPRGDAWMEADGDVLLDFARSGPNKDCMKRFQAKVVNTEASQFVGPRKYQVQLIDASAGFPVCLMQEFIARGHALPSEELSRQRFSLESCSAGVQTILHQFQILLLSGEDAASLNQAAGDVKTRLEQSMSSFSAVDGLLLLSKLGELLAYLRCPQVLCDLLPLVVELARHIGDDMDKYLAVNLLRIMNRGEDDLVREQLVSSLRSLAEMGYSWYLSQYNGLKIFTKLAKELQKIEMLENCLWILVHILPDVVSNPNKVYNSGVVELVCSQLQQSQAAEVWSPVLQIVSILSPISRWNDALRKHGGITALCDIVSLSTINSQMMSQILSILITLTDASLYTRDTLMEKGYLRTFQRLMLVEMPDDMLQLCQDMVHLLTPVASDLEADEGMAFIAKEARAHAKIIRQFVPEIPGIKPIRVPIETELNNSPLDAAENDVVLCSARPQVRWMQDKHHLCLTVEVVNTRGQKPFTILDDRISFRAMSERVEYTFEFPLYELVVVDSADLQVAYREVILALRKKTRGFWPRLLKTKCKLSYLKVDFENIIDSDDSDSEDKEDQLLLSSPLAAINRHRRRQPLAFSAPPQKEPLPIGLGIPEFDDSTEHSSSSEHSDDSRPENDDRRFGFFTL